MKKKHIIIAVDIDGVQRMFHRQLEKIYDRYYPNNNRLPITGWDLSEFFPIGKKINKFIYKDHQEEIFLSADPFPGILRFMKWLHENFTVKIITAQPDPKSKEYAKLWLKKNGIKYDFFYCTYEKELLHYDIIIEDSPKMIPKIKKEGKTVIRMVRPWNKAVDGVSSVRNHRELKFKINELTKEM
jgi:5'(3')-deoxyribonucleotidase